MGSVELKYGRGVVRAPVPENRGAMIISAEEVMPLENPRAELKKKLFKPSGRESLSAICARAENVCVVISDKTRFFPYNILFREILAAIEESGPAPFILVACGMHSPSGRKDLEEMLGREIVEKYKIINHDAEDAKNNVNIGTTAAGAPILVNRHYLEADVKVSTGLIEPHFMAGFSGGRKSICPGISGYETIKLVHSAKIIGNPMSKAGILRGNPCSEIMGEVARAAGCDFIVNVTVNRMREITGIFCGHPEEAFNEGADACIGQCSAAVEGSFDVVVTSGGGYPLDRDFYQTVKALSSAADIAGEGGTIICASRCSDGIGSREFRDLLYGMQDIDEFMDEILSGGCFRKEQWEVQILVKVLRKCAVKLYSGGLSEDEIRKCWCEPVTDFEGEVRHAATRNSSVRAAFIPDGPHVLIRRLKEPK